MTNEEYLKRWDQHSDVMKFNLDDIYSLLFVEDGESVDDTLDYVLIKKDRLINSHNKKINKSMGIIDDLLLETSEFLRVFIVDNVFDEVTDDVLISEYHQTKSEIGNIHSKISDQIVFIRSELDKEN